MSPIYYCPECDRKNLVPPETSGPIRCRFCGATLDQENRAEGTDVEEGDADEVTPSQDLELEKPPVPTEPEPEREEEEETEESKEVEAEEESGRQVGTGGAFLSFWAGLTGSLGCVWSLAAAFSLLLAGQSELAATGQVIMASASLAVILATLLTFRYGSVGPMFGGILAMFGVLLCLGLLVESAVSLGSEISNIEALALHTSVVARGFVGLAGLLIFCIFVRGGGWARRSVALTLLCVLVVGIALWGNQAAAAVRGELRALEPLRAQFVPLMVALLGGFMVALSVARAARSEHLGVSHVIGSMAGLLVAGSAAAYTCYSLSSDMDWQVAAQRTVQIAWPLVAAAVVPVMLAAMGWAWGTRAGIGKDALNCSRFGWGLAFPATAIAVALWLPSALSQGQFEAGVVAFGGIAVLLAAYIGLRRDPWIARWVLVPAILGSVALLGSMGAFRAGMVPQTSWVGRILGSGPGIFLWLLVVVPVILATGGLAVATRVARGPHAHRADANIIHTTGWMISATVLLLVYVVAAGTPTLAEGVRSSLGAVGQRVAEALRVMTGNDIAGAVSGGFSRLESMIFAGGWGIRAVAAVVMVVALAVHIASRHGSRWCSRLVIVLWALITAALVALTAVAGARLFSPTAAGGFMVFSSPSVDHLSTAWGKTMATSLTLRLLVVALLLGLLWRLCDSVRGVHRMTTRTAEDPQAKAPSKPLFGSLGSLGILACIAGLILAVMLGVDVSSEAVFFHLEQIAVDLRSTFVFGAANAGVFAATSIGGAFCVAATLVMLIALHEETRRGRITAYPWVALLWLGVLARLGLSGYGRLSAMAWPVPPGARLAIVVIGLLWLILLVFTLALIRRWIVLVREEGRYNLETAVTGRVSSSAKTLGAVGLTVSITAAVIGVYMVLVSYPELARRLQTMERGLERASALVMNAVKGWRGQLQESNLLTVAAAGVGLVSVALLILHFLAQHGVRWAGVATTALWSGASVAGIGLFGRMVDFRRFGEWELGELMGALAAAIVIVAVLAATASSWVQLVSQGKEQRQAAA